ncbi:MAG: hypothetical protein ACERKN_13705 [Velocimicrobium sp.]
MSDEKQQINNSNENVHSTPETIPVLNTTPVKSDIVFESFSQTIQYETKDSSKED